MSVTTTEANLLQVCPILCSYDIDKTEAFYQQVNFTTSNKYPDYLIMHREDIMLHFTLMTMGDPTTTMTQAYIYVRDVQPIYEEVQAAGAVHPNGKLKDLDYGMRQFTLLDVDGNAVFFGQAIS